MHLVGWCIGTIIELVCCSCLHKEPKQSLSDGIRIVTFLSGNCKLSPAKKKKAAGLRQKAFSSWLWEELKYFGNALFQAAEWLISASLGCCLCSLIDHWSSARMNRVPCSARAVLLSVPARGDELTRWSPQGVAGFVPFPEVKQPKSQARSANIYFGFVCAEPDVNPHANPAIFTK